MELRKGMLLRPKKKYEGYYCNKCVIDFFTHEVCGEEWVVVFLGVNENVNDICHVTTLDQLIIYYEIM